jgi:cytochrome c oxidase cbb3-type subunit 4
MDIDHDTLTAFAKTFGLFYLMAMFLGTVAYAFWPSKKREFDRAARSVLDDEDGPREASPREDGACR